MDPGMGQVQPEHAVGWVAGHRPLESLAGLIPLSLLRKLQAKLIIGLAPRFSN
jgi:hypothetical protein